MARTRIDQLYFNDDVVQFFKPGNIDDLADAMILLGKEKILGEKQAANALKFADQYKWKSNKYLYLQIVDKKGLN